MLLTHRCRQGVVISKEEIVKTLSESEKIRKSSKNITEDLFKIEEISQRKFFN